jgi:diguanylate cyclase (GGDEF)-like protein
LGGSLVQAVMEQGAGRTHAAGSDPATGSGQDGVSAAVAVPVRQVLREKRLLNERRRSAYSVPFTKVLGVLYLENHDRIREFTEDDQLVLQVFADHVANAVSNDVLYRQASTDNLTGLASRRYLDLRLADELEFAQRNTCPLSVVMLDIDDFKQINDQYGHQAGDEILRQIGAILKSSVRKFDVCGRYGGEEFILALPETDPQGAQVVAENVRERIAGSKFLDDEHPVPVTVSLGVATFPALASDLTSLIGAADRALYRAKRGGKNRHALAEQRMRGAGE